MPVGEKGELWVRGPNVTPGYWNRPEATAEAITDGWLHTGDAAQEDEDGFIYIVDRWKDMYISGGENVYPAEIEGVIYQLPQIGEVSVIGIPDEKWVEVGRAIVVVNLTALRVAPASVLVSPSLPSFSDAIPSYTDEAEYGTGDTSASASYADPKSFYGTKAGSAFELR